MKGEPPKQVLTRESPVKRDRMPPSAGPLSVQQDRRPQDRREEVVAPSTQRESVTGTPIQKENGPTLMSGRNQPSSYEPTGLLLNKKVAVAVARLET